MLVFAVPTSAVFGISLGLVVQETGSFEVAFGTPTVMLMGVLALVILIWGLVFVARPIVTLTSDGLLWPNGRKLLWVDVEGIEVGQSTSTAVSANAPARNVVHEVVTLRHKDGALTKIVTTWAADGFHSANDQIQAAFDQKQ